MSSFPAVFLRSDNHSDFVGSLFPSLTPTAVSSKIPLAAWVVYAGPLCCHRPAGPIVLGWLQSNSLSHIGTCYIEKGLPGREHSPRQARASSANTPGQICIHFLPDGKIRSSDALHIGRETSSCRWRRTLLPPPPPPVCRSNSSPQFGRLSSRHPPLVSDLHICVVTFQLLFCQRGCCSRHLGSLIAPSGGRRKQHLT